MRRRELSGRRRRHDGRELLQQVLEERYLLKDSQGRVIEDARRMVEKVARAIACAMAARCRSPSDLVRWSNGGGPRSSNGSQAAAPVVGGAADDERAERKA